jgi:hypothetical protein
MNVSDFNKKYSNYLEFGHYGVFIDNERFLKYLNEMFMNIILHHPKFKFTQVKAKFGQVRFYSNLEMETGLQLESELNTYYKTLINQKDGQ